jgi:hypothetical protein
VRRNVARTVRRIAGLGRGRRSASFGAAALGVVLLAGAALGSGIARTAVDVSDGLTWLADSPRGEVVQVNPSSGRPEVRLQVSGGDARLEITQKDGLLVVVDKRTGQITVIDLATLLASGRRESTPGTSKVLVSDGRIYIVDRAAGVVHDADPVTLADVGEPWQSGQSLADAVADDHGVLWAVEIGGTLHALEWSEESQRFSEISNRRVPGAGPHAVLVPHENGVTLLDLDSGAVVQAGTGKDVTASTLQLAGEVLAALTSPVTLVPAAVPDQSTVVIVAGDRVLQVDVGGLGCPRPGRPVVFQGKVYVPCRGMGKVLLLDGSGRRAGADLRTPGSGDPDLVLDDGRLFINTPGGEQGVIVDADGSTRQVTVRSPELPLVNPDRPPVPDVPKPPQPTPRPPEPDPPARGAQPPPGSPVQGVPGTDAGTPTVPTTPSVPNGFAGAPSMPPGVAVMLQDRTSSELTVTISWGASTDNGNRVTGYAVTASGGFTGGSRSTQTTATSVQLTFPCAGTTFCTSGRLDVSVTAASQAGTSQPGTRTWNVPPTQQQTSTSPPAPPSTTTTPPAPPRSTTPPAPPPSTTTPPAPPPAAPVPTAGVVIIGPVPATGGYTRRLTLTPPGDWASHDGRCEVVNLTFSYTYPIACSATTATVDVETGSNRLVVRAHARDNSRSVDSAVRSVAVRDPEPTCGKYKCFSSPARATDPFGAGDAGLGFLALAALLGVRDRLGRKQIGLSRKRISLSRKRSDDREGGTQ